MENKESKIPFLTVFRDFQLNANQNKVCLFPDISTTMFLFPP